MMTGTERRLSMVEIRRAMMVLGATALLVLLSAGSGQADECREARHICMQESVEATHVCRQECRADVRDTIDGARTTCDEQSLDEEACRALVHESLKAVSADCRNECHELRQDARTSCREAKRDCREAVVDPLDDACVDSCREEFEPCRDDQKLCIDECREGVEAAVDECRNQGLDFREMLHCIHDARRSMASCAMGCHDTNSCHGGLGECLRECPTEDGGEGPS